MGVQTTRTLSLFKASRSLDQLYFGHPLLFGLGVAMLIVAIPTVIAAGVDARTLNGVSVWTKPLKFQISLALHCFTIAYFMTFLPKRQRGGLMIGFFVAVIVATALFEIIYISLQAARGEASHFNLTTETARLMYSLMAIAAVLLLTATAGIGALVLRQGVRGEPMAFACGLGLVIGSILGGLTGLYLGGQTGHWIGGVASDAQGIPILGWSRSGGDLRVAHFFGLHAIQMIPAATWCLGHAISRRTLKVAALVVSGCACALTWAVFQQAKQGLPFIVH